MKKENDFVLTYESCRKKRYHLLYYYGRFDEGLVE